MNYSAENNLSIANYDFKALKLGTGVSRTNPFNAANLVAATVRNPIMSAAVQAAATSLPGFSAEILPQISEIASAISGKLAPGFTKLETESGPGLAAAKKPETSTEEETASINKAKKTVDEDIQRTALSSAVPAEAIQPLSTNNFNKDALTVLNNINFGRSEGNV